MARQIETPKEVLEQRFKIYNEASATYHAALTAEEELRLSGPAENARKRVQSTLNAMILRANLQGDHLTLVDGEDTPVIFQLPVGSEDHVTVAHHTFSLAIMEGDMLRAARWEYLPYDGIQQVVNSFPATMQLRPRIFRIAPVTTSIVFNLTRNGVTSGRVSMPTTIEPSPLALQLVEALNGSSNENVLIQGKAKENVTWRMAVPKSAPASHFMAVGVFTLDGHQDQAKPPEYMFQYQTSASDRSARTWLEASKPGIVSIPRDEKRQVQSRFTLTISDRVILSMIFTHKLT